MLSGIYKFHHLFGAVLELPAPITGKMDMIKVKIIKNISNKQKTNNKKNIRNMFNIKFIFQQVNSLIKPQCNYYLISGQDGNDTQSMRGFPGGACRNNRYHHPCKQKKCRISIFYQQINNSDYKKWKLNEIELTHTLDMEPGIDITMGKK